MTRESKRAFYPLALVLLIGIVAPLNAQFKYTSGQDVGPVFEGWERNADGSFSMVFGYLNRNYEEEVDIPIGPNNTVEPGGDRGQPTHFYPRRGYFVFRVSVPKDWDKSRRVVWTLTTRGRTNTAKAWLNQEMELNPGVISMNNGGGVLWAGNQPPKITGSPEQSVILPNTLTLTAAATDDGLPRPRPPRNPPSGATGRGSNPNAAGPPPLRGGGLGIRWIYYRGVGQVTFDPDRIVPVYGKPVEMTTKVTFSAPGTYVLRAIASDRQLEALHEVTVTVEAATENR